ncbi:hypothetical protein [Mesorhizobium sp.]|uniref:hypothetical protein n=1 Tax=Mesorhizobium sp. TaxID=1871066 RepID=UPI0025D50ECE|nr:hypothetical protein [Mesorhizobium sp.]
MRSDPGRRLHVVAGHNRLRHRSRLGGVDGGGLLAGIGRGKMVTAGKGAARGNENGCESANGRVHVRMPSGLVDACLGPMVSLHTKTRKARALFPDRRKILEDLGKRSFDRQAKGFGLLARVRKT